MNRSRRSRGRRAWEVYRPINFAIWLILSVVIVVALIWKAGG